MCDKIETVDPGFGIEIMRLAATAAEPFATRQIISSLIDEPEADVSGFIDILSNRVGKSRLYRYAPASDVPERSVPAGGRGGSGHWRGVAHPLAPPCPVISPA